MMRSILLTLLLLFVACIPQFCGMGAKVCAQNLSQPLAGKESSNLRILARPYGDSITLRWAPTNFPTWSQLRRHGVIVERRRIGGEKAFSSVPSERIIALSLADIMSFADTSNVHVVAVAEAMYGEATPGTNEGPLGRAKDINEEQTQRLFLALLNADLSAAAADVLGWRYVDRDVRPGFTYEYRLRVASPEPTYGDTLRVRSDGNFYAGPVVKVRGEAGDGKVHLHWPRTVNEVSFTAYRLEVSEDGNNWRYALDLPLLPEPTEDGFGYTIKEVPNGTPRHYRLRGINAFGETCPPSEVVVITARDQTAPPAPLSVNGDDLRDGRNRLRWTVPKEMPADLAGYRVLRGLSLRGKLVPAHDDLLPPGTSNWVDPTPTPDRNNYYAIEAVDQAGNSSRSPVNFVQRWDDTPPAQPTGLTGRIDTTGRVFLLWDAGTEPDLLGYRVYRSHARDREFLQITNEVQHRNFFFDSTSLLVLNETVLYQIVAVDRHYNPSPYSVILELRRPDKVAPSAPSISSYAAGGNTVSLTIRPSNSGDVIRQTVWRDNQPIAAIGARDTSFIDTTVAVRSTYAYTVRAEDEVGLFGASHPLTVRTGIPTDRAGVIDLARTQVQSEGKSKEVLRWSVPANSVTGFQVYQGPSAESLRPTRRLGSSLEEWPVPDPTQFYALRVIYGDGSRSPLSVITEPLK